jgi:hypothetical protein
LYGWSVGGILRERRTESFSEPVPVDEMDRELFEEYLFPSVAAVMGEVRLEEPGEYEWSVQPTNPCWVRLDERTLIKTRKSGGESRVSRLRLEAGTHRLEARVLLQTQGKIPDVSYRKVGDTEWTRL